MTIRSYRDSLKQRRSSHGHATLPVPSIQLMTTTDSVLFFPLESDEEKRIRIVIRARLCFDSLERWITFNGIKNEQNYKLKQKRSRKIEACIDAIQAKVR